MSADWETLSRKAGLQVEGKRAIVQIGQRTQSVSVEADTDQAGFTLTSSIASAGRVRELGATLIERIGQQNRLSELVGYRLDRRGRLIGESWCPTAGLTTAEWRFYVRNLAEACDRLEFVLTGLDRG